MLRKLFILFSITVNYLKITLSFKLVSPVIFKPSLTYMSVLSFFNSI